MLIISVSNVVGDAVHIFSPQILRICKRYLRFLGKKKRASTQLSWLISGVNKAEAKVVLPFRVNTVAKNLE